MNGPCIDPDTAASYAARALTSDEASSVEQHIDGCASCRVLISTVASTARSSEPTVPYVEVPDALLRKGTRLGPYEILEPLEAGGMGVVYAALDARLDRKVALKAVRAGAQSAGHRGQLLQEAKLMAQLAHPNVVPVYDVVDSGQLYVAMELVVGQSLRQWLADAPRTWQQIVDAFLEAGEGLAAAHAAGIVHGDVKPSNVLVGDDGRVRVTDFGLASLLEAPRRDDAVRGTPGYVAPEHLAGHANDARADQYAFCVSLHEALFGSFPGQPALKHPKAPRGLLRVIARGLSEAPAARFPSMRELLVALRAVRSARLRWALAGGAVLVLSVAAAFLGGARNLEAAQCTAAAASLASPWNDETRGQVTHAFGATNVGWAKEVLTRVTARLDAWQGRFDEARKEACAPSLFGARVPAAELTERLECLTEAARQARGVISQLREPDAAIQLNAVALTESLKLDCRPRGARLPTPLLTSTTGPTLEALRDDFARVYALCSAGRNKPALELAKSLMPRAEATGDERLRAAALVALGMTQERTNDFPNAVKNLQAAVRLTERLEDDRLRAQAWVTLLQAEYHAGHFDRALDLETATLGAAERVGDAWLQSEALLFLGGAASARDQVPRAKALFEEAVALREKTWGPEDRRTAFALSALGNALAMQGDLAPAIDAHRRSLAAAEAALGPLHPSVGTLRGNLGDDYLYGLDAPAAVEALGRSVELFEKNEPRSREVANLGTDYGFALLLAGKKEDALARFERSLELWGALAPQHPLRAMALLGRHEALLSLGRERTTADLETALGLAKALPPFERGRVQLALGLAVSDPGRARTLITDAELGLKTTPLPLIKAAHERAQRWLAEQPR